MAQYSSPVNLKRKASSIKFIERFFIQFEFVSNLC